MVVPLLLVFMLVLTGLALFPQLALGVVTTLSYICDVHINVRLKVAWTTSFMDHVEKDVRRAIVPIFALNTFSWQDASYKLPST